MCGRGFRYAGRAVDGLKWRREAADEIVMRFCHLKRPAPMSNTERQRRFRERNPGYYGRLHRQRNAEVALLCAQRVAVGVGQEAGVVARVPLMLPAPEQASNYDGALLLQQLQAAVARREEACVLVERDGGEADSEPLQLPARAV